MPVLQNISISPPRAEYRVAFSTNPSAGHLPVRRAVTVLAGSPSKAAIICKQRYPHGRAHAVMQVRPLTKKQDDDSWPDLWSD